MRDCIFCKIVAGEIPADKVYEDEHYLAFLDIAPISLGHTLVIPKDHHPTLLDTPDEILKGCIVVVKKVGSAVIKAVNASAFSLGVGNGKEAGQEVFHLHFHVIPRFSGDGLEPWGRKQKVKYDAANTAEQIRQAF